MNLQSFLTGWHFTRWFRLGLGIFVMIQSIQTTDYMAGVLGILLLFQAVTNTGCCGVSGCSTIYDPKDEKESFEFEEIKIKSEK